MLKRDGYRCRLRKEGCTTVATHVHHTRGKGAGDDPAYLLAACPSCNLKVGDPTKRDARPMPRTQWGLER